MEENKKANNMLLFIGVFVAIALVGGGLFFLNSSRMNTGMGGVSSDTQDMVAKDINSEDIAKMPSEGTSEIDQSTIKTFMIDAGGFYYKPDIIRVNEGDQVKIEMKSVDMMHDFNIDELGIKIPVTKSGETSSVVFTAEKKGEYEFYCSVGQHRQNGQVGKLIIE